MIHLKKRRWTWCQWLWKDALALFAWINREWTLHSWDELITVFQENFEPLEYVNLDDYLYSIKQEGSVQEYRLEFAKRSARVKHWPEHYLLGTFLNRLHGELRADVHKTKSVYQAISLALEFEGKLQPWGPKPNLMQTQNQSPNALASFTREQKHTTKSSLSNMYSNSSRFLALSASTTRNMSLMASKFPPIDAE